MGFTPAMVDAMTFYEFDACCEGYERSQGSGEDEQQPPTLAEFRAVMDAPLYGRLN